MFRMTLPRKATDNRKKRDYDNRRLDVCGYGMPHDPTVLPIRPYSAVDKSIIELRHGAERAAQECHAQFESWDMALNYKIVAHRSTGLVNGLDRPTGADITVSKEAAPPGGRNNDCATGV
jgi:hypothetical protein